MAKPTLLLFDVDGTLTVPRLSQTPEMRAIVADLRKAGFFVGVVGGSDFKKQEEQLGLDVLEQFDYVFSENGLRAFKGTSEFHRQNLVKFLGNDNIKRVVKTALRLIADADIPVQRGTFVELRNGMFNISPIGRNCSQEERDEFEQYDHQHNIRKDMIKSMREALADLNLQFSIGGQISFDVFPAGWDKTYSLQFVTEEFGDIHFFGDKTYEGGNDFEIFEHHRTIGHSVKNFNETIAILQEMLNSQK
jgi:phosphomannomutase